MIITKPCPEFTAEEIGFDYTVREFYADRKDKIGEKLIKERYNLLKSMHNVICFMNMEDAYLVWIHYIPDEATSEDLLEICLDSDFEEFNEIVEAFKRIMESYGKFGFICGNMGLMEVYGQTQDDFE